MSHGPAAVNAIFGRLRPYFHGAKAGWAPRPRHSRCGSRSAVRAVHRKRNARRPRNAKVRPVLVAAGALLPLRLQAPDMCPSAKNLVKFYE